MKTLAILAIIFLILGVLAWVAQAISVKVGNERASKVCNLIKWSCGAICLVSGISAILVGAFA